MKLVCSGYTEERRSARFKGWANALASPRFTILRADDTPIVDCDMGTMAITTYTVSLEGHPARTISRKDIQPTARLYCDAQRLRKSIGTAPLMLIRPNR
ncbi:MAG: hypothetical protein WC315_00850 [Candidatus Omnitrophota bacterium]|jgi:hypothetical protein